MVVSGECRAGGAVVWCVPTRRKLEQSLAGKSKLSAMGPTGVERASFAWVLPSAPGNAVARRRRGGGGVEVDVLRATRANGGWSSSVWAGVSAWVCHSMWVARGVCSGCGRDDEEEFDIGFTEIKMGSQEYSSSRRYIQRG